MDHWARLNPQNLAFLYREPVGESAHHGRWCQGHSKIRRNVRRMIEIAPQGIIL
jgi:hypothetical protein